jgi:hypothetical protein
LDSDCKHSAFSSVEVVRDPLLEVHLMWRIIASLFVLASCVLLAACGGSMSQSSTSPSPVSNGVPMSLTIGDAPPSGVAVLFFEASITGASLQPSDTSKPPVPVLSTPVEVEFGHLQTDTAFLNLANVTPDTYQSMTLTFANAVMTIVNHSGATIGSCGNNSVCELTPNFNPSAATVSSSPFPLTIGQNSVVGIQLDFNVDASVQSDLSISPAVTIKQLTQRQDSDENQEMAELDDVDGLVTAIGTNQFTLTNERSGQSFTISVDSNTRFQDFDGAGCTANPANLTCLQAGAIVSVDLSENGSGTMLAKSVEFEANANQQAIKGIITSVDSATQYHMVVFNEEPTVNGIAEGTAVVVAIQPNAVFLVGRDEMDEEHGFSMPDLLFTSSADLLVGQDVQIEPSPRAVASTRSAPTWCACGRHRSPVKWAALTAVTARSP